MSLKYTKTFGFIGLFIFGLLANVSLTMAFFGMVVGGVLGFIVDNR